MKTGLGMWVNSEAAEAKMKMKMYLKKPGMKCFAFLFLLVAHPAFAGQIAFTMDDLRSDATLFMKASERTKRVLQTLKEQGDVKAALFVCGRRVDNPEGKKLLARWDEAGHLIGNHSYSHLYYHSSKIPYEKYTRDLLKGEAVISRLAYFSKFFRFPFLKEGNSKEKRDRFREFLKKQGYRVGHVSVDASDWYIDARMRKKLKENPDLDLKPYRDYYLEHVWERTQFYDGLARKVTGREIKHTLLMHDNLLNALFLKDLISMFQEKGWEVIDATEAFADPVFLMHPDILPAGESIVWALAKETGKYDEVLRYPGEDSRYEEEKMNRLGL